jgi:formylglycine-generating enzyme required for sulfatase activity
MKKIFYVFLGLFFLTGSLYLSANNIKIDNTPTTVGQNTTAGVNNAANFTYVQFDMSWDNSWHNAINYDAAWIFVKYRNGSTGNWNHCLLSSVSSDHSVNNNNGVAVSIEAVADNLGIFIHRSGDGTGSNNWDGVTLRWNYGANGVPDSADVTVKVFVIEMVYVPQGTFYLGSGGGETAHFYTYPASAVPYGITSENAINVGATNDYLYYSTGGNYGDGSGPVPASFPKGYNAFYCMKYEITQEQYADFLNSLTIAQRLARFANSFNSYRNYIKMINGVIGCDKDNDNTMNEAGDGQNIACNYLSWADGVAYSDWAGLRPMTELEFEKACRGTNAPYPNEYAWGNTGITGATGIINSGFNNEAASNTGANCVYNNAGGAQGPMRVGCFATGTSNRQQAGASFYGIMEMSGNLWERTVTIGNASGRAFTGQNGNGQLTSTGDANVSNWPSVSTAQGAGCRGGSWHDDYSDVQVSDRDGAAYTDTSRGSEYGFRSVRSAP